MFVIAVCCKSSDIIRNGSRDGTITVDQSESADLVDASISVGKMIQNMAMKNTIKEKMI